MNRRNFLRTSATATAAAAVLGPKAFASVLAPRSLATDFGPTPLALAGSAYTRSMHFVYGILNNPVLTSTDQAIKNALGGVRGGVTCLNPFLLNCNNPLKPELAPMINWTRDQGIAIIPAVGFVADGKTRLNDFPNGPHATIAKAYWNANLGPHIRLENLSGFYSQPGGQADVTGFIQNCIELGFTKIMLNPWPVNGNQYMPIGQAMLKCIDATFQSVHPGADWVTNPKQIDTLNKLHPPMHIVVNYESPGPQEQIGRLSQPGQINVFKTTVNDLESYPASARLHWAPPFTRSYNPLEAGTRTWDSYIEPTLSSFQ